MQVRRRAELTWIESLIMPIFITTVVIYSLSIICLVVSIINLSCILKTQERKYKNTAHVAWISAFIVMMFGSISACFITMASLFTEDHCVALAYTEKHKDVSGVPQIYP